MNKSLVISNSNSFHRNVSPVPYMTSNRDIPQPGLHLNKIMNNFYDSDYPQNMAATVSSKSGHRREINIQQGILDQEEQLKIKRDNTEMRQKPPVHLNYDDNSKMSKMTI